jgi:hypothetical protein
VQIHGLVHESAGPHWRQNNVCWGSFRRHSLRFSSFSPV